MTKIKGKEKLCQKKNQKNSLSGLEFKIGAPVELYDCSLGNMYLMVIHHVGSPKKMSSEP